MTSSLSSRRRRLKFRVFCILVIVACISIQFAGQFSHLLNNNHSSYGGVFLYWTENLSTQPTSTGSDQPISATSDQSYFSPQTAERGYMVVTTTRKNETKPTIVHPSIPNPHERFHQVLRKKQYDELRERQEDPVSSNVHDKTRQFITSNYYPNSTHRPSRPIDRKDEIIKDQFNASDSSITPRLSGMNNVNLLLARQKSNANAKRRYGQSPFIQGYKTTGGKLPLDTAEYLMDANLWKDVDNGTCITTTNISSNPNSIVGDEEEWQHRAPYAILLGAMKSGTHAVTASLWEHPAIAPNGHWELHFFDSDKAIRSERGIDRQRTIRNYAVAFGKSLTGSNFTKTSIDIPNARVDSEPLEYYAIESSPRYLLNSDRLPDMILCTVPWVKLIAILRNPIERAASQYRFLDEVRKKYSNAMVGTFLFVTTVLHNLYLMPTSIRFSLRLIFFFVPCLPSVFPYLL